MVDSIYLNIAREVRADRRSKDIADVFGWLGSSLIFEKLLCMKNLQNVA